MRFAMCSMIAVSVACVPAAQPMQPNGPYAPAYSAGGFAGTWVTQGGTMTLEERGGQVTGTIQSGGLQGAVQGVVQGDQLDGTLTMPDGSSGRFVARSDGNQLAVDVGRAQPLVFARAGERAARGDEPPAGPPAPAPMPAPRPATGDATPVPAFTARAATGAPVWDQYKGWEVKTPAGWKHAIQDRKLVFGSQTETGVIIVQFFDGLTFERAAAALDGEIRKLGATPVGAPRAEAASAGRALIAELSGEVNGAVVQGRAIGIEGPSGMLSVLGFAVVDRFKTLRQRVDAIAQSTRFFTPERGQVGLVSGCFRSSSGGSHTWVERSLYFDGNGRFSKQGSVATQGHDVYGKLNGSSASLMNNDGGTYTVEGNTVRLLWNDGSRSAFELQYERGALGALKSGSTWYLRC